MDLRAQSLPITRTLTPMPPLSLSAAALVLLAISAASSAAPPVFSIADRAVGERHLKVLQNTQTGESVEVIWDWGGKLARVQLGGRSSKPRDIISTHCADLESCTAKDLEEGATEWGAPLLIPFANRVAFGHYDFGGQTHYLSKDNSTVSHGFLVKGEPMKVLSARSTLHNATLVLSHTFTGDDLGYPFTVGVNVSYTLSTTGLTVTIRAKNLMDAKPAPFMAGAHPYFHLLHSKSDEAKVVLDRSCSEWNRQGQTKMQVPNGRASAFHGFNGTDSVLDPHPTCPACEDGIWDDGFTALAPRADCPVLEARIIDGPDTMLLALEEGFRYVQVRA